MRSKKTLKHNTNWIYFDCDDTLVMWGLQTQEGFDDNYISIRHNGQRYALVPHRTNINALKDYYDMGWTVVVWSAGGLHWARKVTKSLGLNKYVHHMLAKPYHYVDDIRCCEFMGRNVYIPFDMGETDELRKKEINQ